MPAEIGWSVVHPVVDIEISSEIVASPDFAPYLSFELIYTVAVECALLGLTEVSSIQPQSDLRSVETVGSRPENFGAEKAGRAVKQARGCARRWGIHAPHVLAWYELIHKHFDKAGRAADQIRQGRPRSVLAAGLSAKMLAVPADAIFKWKEPGRAALDDAGLCQVVDNLRRHAKTARQGVG